MLTLLAFGDEVYFERNRFEGLIRGTGADLMVDLERFAEVLKLRPEDANGGVYLGRSGQGRESTEAGAVCLEGRLVKSADEGGKLLVNLKEASDALGLRYKTTGQRIDLFIPSGWMSGQSAPVTSTAAKPYPVTLTPGHVLELNQATPGKWFDADPYLVGRTLWFFYDANFKEKEFKVIPAMLDEFASAHPEVTVIKVSSGPPGVSEIAKKMGRIPQIRLLNGRRNTWGWPGHSMLGDFPAFLKDPEKIKRWRP